MNLILHKAASILVYRYYNACNLWFLTDYADNSDIINSRAVISCIIDDIERAYEGVGVLTDISKSDLIDFRKNLESKINFVNKICGIEETADIVLDDMGDTVYLYDTTDPHWEPIPMSWMTFLTPNEQYKLGAGLHDLVNEYLAYREAITVTQNKVSDTFKSTAFAVTTELNYNSELADEIRNLSIKFYTQTTNREAYAIGDVGYAADLYWNDTVSIWYEMDTIIDELSSKDELDEELGACIEELRFNKFSVQAENDMWISYKPDTDKSIINVAFGEDEHHKEIKVSDLTFSTSDFMNNFDE